MRPTADEPSGEEVPIGTGRTVVTARTDVDQSATLEPAHPSTWRDTPCAPAAPDPEHSSPQIPVGSVSSTEVLSPGATPQARRSFDAPPDFGLRYQAVRHLRRGGMGDVYRAYDTELERDVALKVIRSDREAQGTLAERFRREIALASKVTHKNVLRVYDLGQSGSVRFLSMQFVDGEDLATLMRPHRLPAPRVLALFRQICEGLAAAHDNGVIHRDLKPLNVLVDKNDNVFVADFGLALSFEDVSATASIVGSPSYMSPEQVMGEPVDARTDIFSLGVVLYELLTGSTPYGGGSAHEIMQKRVHSQPRPWRELNPDVPSYLDGVLARCLARAPADRYPSVHALLADLDARRASPPVSATAPRRRLLAVLGLGALLACVALAGRAVVHHEPLAPPSASGALAAASVPAMPSALASAPGPTTLAATVRPSVLVLGIRNDTADPFDTDTLAAVLGVALYRSQLVQSYAGFDLQNLAAELQVPQTIDEKLGKLLAARDGGKVVNARVTLAAKGMGYLLTLTATDAATGDSVLTRTLEATDTSRVVPTLGLISCALRSLLGDAPPSDPALAEQTGMSVSLEADHELTVGRQLSNSGKYTEGALHLERAVALDPELARAHAALGMAYWNLDRQAEAEKQYKLAIRWIDRMGERERLKLLGDYYSTVGEFDRSIATYEESLKKWPGDYRAETNLTIAYAQRRDMTHAIELSRRAVVEHPTAVLLRSNLAGFYAYASDFETARAESAKVIADLPSPAHEVYVYQAVAEAELQHGDEAFATYQKLEGIDPSLAASGIADLLASQGRVDEALKLLGKAIADDEAAKNADGALAKTAMLAELDLELGATAGAKRAADKAATAASTATVFMAAEVFLATGQDSKALAVEQHFEQGLSPETRTFAKLLHGEALRRHHKAREAIAVLTEAQGVMDTWLGHLALGQAYLDLGAFAEAYAELKTCMTRSGEGAFAFLDLPTIRYVATLRYYLARAQDGVDSPDAAESYRAFLATRPDVKRDPLVADARARLSTRKAR